jgi:radical SAM superfamily enzyme YgiQ (UPF0313 family)
MRSMKRILLINPPIYDFSAYDFWLKPLGLLRVAAQLEPFAGLTLYDYLDRLDPSVSDAMPSDMYGRGHFPSQSIAKPPQFAKIPRRFHRFGLPREDFNNFLAENPPFDAALIQTTMTYWYPGAAEVIGDLRRRCPETKIVLGGFYAQACPQHAQSLGADIVISTSDLSPLYDGLGIDGGAIEAASKQYRPPLWSAYPLLKTAAITLTSGCPFKCTYCWQGTFGPPFGHRPIEHCLQDIELLLSRSVTDIAFYDDALLVEPQAILIPFLRHIIDNRLKINLHTPNALHANLITPQLAELMTEAGFKTFYLGYESSSETFHRETGGKIVPNRLKSAVESLISCGFPRKNITAYAILGHPQTDLQQLADTMHFANDLGIHVTLADFSPIPGTPDGELCRKYVDLDEPLNHNKTAFPITFLGFDKVNQFKDLRHLLNNSLATCPNETIGG